MQSEKDKKRLIKENKSVLKTEIPVEKPRRSSNDRKNVLKPSGTTNRLNKTESPSRTTDKNISTAKKSNTSLNQTLSKSTTKSNKSTKDGKTEVKTKIRDSSREVHKTKVSSTTTKKVADSTNKVKEPIKRKLSTTNDIKISKQNKDVALSRKSVKEVKHKNKVLDTYSNVTVQSPPARRKSIVTRENSPVPVFNDTKNESRSIEENVPKVPNESNEINTKLQISDDEQKQSTSSRVRTQTRTLDTSEIKVLKSISYSIDLSDPTGNTEEPSNEDYEYEDDFESYESDFESYNSSEGGEESEKVSILQETSKEDDVSTEDSKKDSTKFSIEEERKMDSGNYDLRPKQPIITTLANISESNDSSMKVLDDQNIQDEGFVEQINKNLVKQKHFLDFSQKLKSTRVKERISKRGKDILEKLTLDEMTFQIFEMKPLTYNEYMNIYGNSDCVQTSSQTKDDNLSVEIQTEDIVPENKWTQYPISYTKNEENGNFIYQTLCSGSDIVNHNTPAMNSINFYELNRFLRSTGPEMLLYMEEQIRPKLKHNKIDMKISDGHYKLRFDTKLLRDMHICCLEFSKNSNLVSACYVKNDLGKDDTMYKVDESGDSLNYRNSTPESVICIWHVQNPLEPNIVLGVYGIVTRCTFLGTHDDAIIAGCKDGSIVCWDLLETDCHSNLNGHMIRYPSHIIMDDETDHGAVSEILCLNNETEENINVQVCVLQQYGFLSMWSLIRTDNVHNSNLTYDFGLSLYSKVRLIRNHTVDIILSRNKNANHDGLLTVYEKMCIDSVDNRTVYVIPKDSKCVIGCSVNWMKRLKYYIVENDTPLSISSNPYKQPWFVVGCTRIIVVYKKLISNPLIVIPISTNDSVPYLIDQNYTKFIQISPSNPNFIFVSTTTQIFVVDLLKQEILSKCDLGESISGLKMYRKTDRDYMVISHTNRIDVHKISKKFRLNNTEDIDRLVNEQSKLFKLF